MADLPESNEWTPGVYQLETSDPVLGGPEGIDNLQAKQLANRSKWLKDQIQKLIDGVTVVGKAAQLATARTLKFKGAATGSGSYDGSAETEITLTLVDSGITAGSYTKVTFNAKGVATAGSNPTTLDGYGITDGFATAIAGGDYNGLIKSGLYVFPASNTPNLPAGYSGSGAFHHTISDYAFTLSYDLATDSVAFRRTLPGGYGSWRSLWHSGNFTPGSKADKATTLAGYGIALASQEDVDAEVNFDNTRPMTVLRVVQTIQKFVKPATEIIAGVVRRSTQVEVDAGTEDASYVTPKKLSKFVVAYVGSALVSATEVLSGLAKIATQALVDAGVDDATYVTPKKMRWGFQILKAANGYIIFPSFLGGLIIQWGNAPVAASTTALYALPIPFPNNYFVGVCQSTTLGMTTNYTTGFGIRPLGKDRIELQNNYSGSGISLGYIAIGN